MIDTCGLLADCCSSLNISSTVLCLSTLGFFLGTRLYVPILLFFLRDEKPAEYDPTAQVNNTHSHGKTHPAIIGTFLRIPRTKWVFLRHLVGAWLELEELKELQALWELLVKQSALMLAYLVDSEVDGSEQVTAEKISAHQTQPESPFWHFLLLLIPC